MLQHAVRSPRIEKHDGVWVVRDDLLPGGTKSRIFRALMMSRAESEFVYASPGVGLAQVALAVAAYHTCRQATIFVAKRATYSHRTKQAADFGARIIEVSPGYLNVVQARARAYAEERGAYMVPFGGAGVGAAAITEAARGIAAAPKHVWCAAGSGTVARALQEAWPEASIHAVQVGKPVALAAPAVKVVSPYAYAEACRSQPPFTADRYYEAKAWELLARSERPTAEILFWNVAGAD